MEFHPTSLAGAWLLAPQPIVDERGHFERSFCTREFREHDLETRFVQHSRSRSLRRGTLRGMHFQRMPHQEIKLVTCLSGAIWDVIVDLRPGSSSFGRWQAFELTAENRRQLYVPAGFAHGLQTLRDETEVGYLISQFHNPAAADGLRHDDPILAIEWPLPVTAISVRDQSWPDFAAVRPDLAAGALPRSAPAVSGTLSTCP